MNTIVFTDLMSQFCNRNFNQKMKATLYVLLTLFAINLNAQVGINTQTPETTFDVVGKPNDTSHHDGIIPPRITGDQLANKFYTQAKRCGCICHRSGFQSFGQVINISESGMYYFDGNVWQNFAKEKQPVEYRIVLTFDPNSTAALTATSTWSAPVNYSGNSHAYLTSSKYYTIGTKKFRRTKGSGFVQKSTGNCKCMVSDVQVF